MILSFQDNGGGTVSRPTVDNSINTINTSRLLAFLPSWFSTTKISQISAARVSADTEKTVLEGSGVFGTGENQFDV